MKLVALILVAVIAPFLSIVSGVAFLWQHSSDRDRILRLHPLFANLEEAIARLATFEIGIIGTPSGPKNASHSTLRGAERGFSELLDLVYGYGRVTNPARQNVSAIIVVDQGGAIITAEPALRRGFELRVVTYRGAHVDEWRGFPIEFVEHWIDQLKAEAMGTFGLGLLVAASVSAASGTIIEAQHRRVRSKPEQARGEETARDERPSYIQ